MIYICIPTHNEQQTVGVVLWKLRQVLTEYPRDYQLLVADDASTDKTQDVLEPYTRVLPLTVIRSEQRQGHAASLEMLLREASRRSEYPKRDIVVTLQADFSDEPDDVVTLLKRMEAGADAAVGTRVTQRKQPFVRRVARRLSGFFVRGQPWPEGVATPFEGYRAYRLHAVKRAIEEREGRRLLRYDGWACHAELLRAVLPHARRVEVVEVEDRTDRMQRPSREKPLAAAMQVRAAMRTGEPEGLIGVEDLDRVAATASRARERTAAGNGNGRRGQGAQEGRGRERGRDGRERRDARSRPAAQGGSREEGRRERRPRRERSPNGEAGGERQQSPRAAAERTTSGRRDRPPRQRTSGTAAAGAGAPADERTPAEQEALELLTGPGPDTTAAPGDATDPGTEEGAPRKRRRRRRGRGGRARAGGEGVADGEGDTADGESPEATGRASAGDDVDNVDGGGGDGDDDANGAGDGQRKRRRRGGRRGGRGRRRRSGADAEGQAEGHGADGPASDNQDAPAATGGSPAGGDERPGQE